MATITVTPMERSLEPQSFLDDADPFLQGECVLVRIATPLHLTDANTFEGTALGSTSTGSNPEHFAFIRSAVLRDDASYELNVYPVVSFSRQGGALEGHAALPAAAQPYFIPVPPLSSDHPNLNPEAFGTPIDCGGFSFSRDSWLLVVPYSFILPERRVVSPFWCLHLQFLPPCDSSRDGILRSAWATSNFIKLISIAIPSEIRQPPPMTEMGQPRPAQEAVTEEGVEAVEGAEAEERGGEEAEAVAAE
jgi:hypothetical protein